MKLRLNLENLQVETYETDAGPGAFRGTVRAHDDSRTADCWPFYSRPYSNCTECTCDADACTY